MLDLLSTNIAHAGKVQDFVYKVDKFIINPLILLLFGLAILIFLYGVLEFLLNQASEEKKTTGKSHMLWGIVGITIMLGVWTILGLVQRTVGIPEDDINLETGEVGF
jgi:uncharacterized membrane protein YidH (DUF202 family)